MVSRILELSMRTGNWIVYFFFGPYQVLLLLHFFFFHGLRTQCSMIPRSRLCRFVLWMHSKMRASASKQLLHTVWYGWVQISVHFCAADSRNEWNPHETTFPEQQQKRCIRRTSVAVFARMFSKEWIFSPMIIIIVMVVIAFFFPPDDFFPVC